VFSPEIVAGLAAVFQWKVLFFLVSGVVLGAIFGALPGLTATMGIAVLTPLTFWIPADQALAMLLGVYCGAIPGGGIPAVLMNIPGTPASIASAWDGYPLSQQGKAGLALGINSLMSFAGQLISIAFLVLAAFPIAAFALKFGPAEYFGLALFGISLMAGVSGRHVLKGLLAGTLGLAVAFIGLDPMTAYPRFTFGRSEFLDGISFIPVMIGLFGLSEVLVQISERHGKAQDPPAVLGRIWPRLHEWRRVAAPGFMAAVAGTFIGAIPAAGGDIASVITWEQARRMSKRREEFGKGSIEGLAATCAGCNAVIGGAMTTMLTLGIPGDAPTAVLIGALLIHGLQPGPMLFATNRPFVFTLVFLLLAGAVLIAALGLAGARPLAATLRIPNPWLWSGILLLSIVGSYSLNNSTLDMWVMFAAGVFGFIMRKLQVPLGPLVLGLILGPMMESNLRRALILSRGNWIAPFVRPITLLFVLGSLVMLLWPLLTARKDAAPGPTDGA
jgi:putative tricarboxylic transport membrane protein